MSYFWMARGLTKRELVWPEGTARSARPVPS